MNNYPEIYILVADRVLIEDDEYDDEKHDEEHDDVEHDDEEHDVEDHDNKEHIILEFEDERIVLIDDWIDLSVNVERERVMMIGLYIIFDVQ